MPEIHISLCIVMFLFLFKKQNKNMAPLTEIQLLMSLNFVISASLVITRITSLMQHHDFSGTTMTDEKMTRKERALLLCCLLSEQSAPALNHLGTRKPESPRHLINVSNRRHRDFSWIRDGIRNWSRSRIRRKEIRSRSGSRIRRAVSELRAGVESEVKSE